MNIISTQYTLKNRALEIYVAGCSGNPHCKGCHNPASWSFTEGEEYTSEFFEKIAAKVECFSDLISRIMIFGGEPLDQPHDALESLLNDLSTLGRELWLFTRYELQDVPQSIKDRCTFIKTGRYIESLCEEGHVEYGITLATSNQHIWKKGKDF